MGDRRPPKARFGVHKTNHLFFGLSAMPGVYIAPFEQYQARLALREYDAIALNRAAVWNLTNRPPAGCYLSLSRNIHGNPHAAATPLD